MFGLTQVAPKDAISNIAAWAEFFHLDWAAKYMMSPRWDQVVSILGLIFIVLAVVMWLRAELRARRLESSAKVPTDAIVNDQAISSPAPITPARDVSLSEAMAYADFREWGMFIGAAITTGNQIVDNLERFHQLAHDGALAVWGKRWDRHVWQAVPVGHWLTHHVDFIELLRGDARTKVRPPNDPEPFTDLMVSRAEFEREWPHAAE